MGVILVKVIIPLAAVCGLVALTWFVFWMGKSAGKAIGAREERARRAGIDPAYHRNLVDWARQVVRPPSDDFDSLVVLPAALRERGERLVDQSIR